MIDGILGKRASGHTKGTGQAQTCIPRKRGKMSVELEDDEKHIGTEKVRHLKVN